MVKTVVQETEIKTNEEKKAKAFAIIKEKTITCLFLVTGIVFYTREKVVEFYELMKEKDLIDYLILLIGAFFYTFVSWRWNMALATWIAPIFLMRFFRKQKKVWSTFLALPLLAVGTFLKMRNGWDLPIGLQIGVSVAGPFFLIMVPLYLDRFVNKQYQSILSTLVYPSTIVIIEYLIGITPLGSSFALGASQFAFGTFIQIAAITGIWGISFLLAWTAPIVNLLLEKNFKLERKKLPKAVKIYSIVIIMTMLFGAFRLALRDPSATTVKIGSLAVEHPRDYWGEIVDKKTPEGEAIKYLPEFKQIENKSFTLSEKAAKAGSKIIFWAEGNLPYYEDYEQEFLNKSREFAKKHQVYFAPGVVKFYYGSYVSDNKIIMIAPNGTVVLEYIKTKSWYKTNSDGIIDYVDTPYGRLASTICFDNDYPNFVRQIGKAKVDILLIPSFDTEVIKDFHSEVALFRGLENGVSIVRHSNYGTACAIDYLGNVVAYQDFFDTKERLMLADLQTKGTFTLYSVLGDWIVYSNFAIMAMIITQYCYRKRRSKSLKVIEKSKEENSD
jgi:apolipoprotein N-acyltransferase